MSEIVCLVGTRGFQTIDALAQHFDVTVQTIRRDLNALAAEGLIGFNGKVAAPSKEGWAVDAAWAGIVAGRC